MKITDNLKRLYKELESTECKLVAVSKLKSIELIMQIYNAGHRSFGENKVQDMVAKANKLPNDIEWHMIGHLQRNKVKYIAPFVSLIHSVDSLRLLREINKQAINNNRVINCLLQVHIAEEESKFGLSEAEMFEMLRTPETAELKNIEIIGLMGMATYTENTDQIRKEFQYLRELFLKIQQKKTPDNINMKELSMGMTSDYRIAMEYGSTMVRIGTAIFGSRN